MEGSCRGLDPWALVASPTHLSPPFMLDRSQALPLTWALCSQLKSDRSQGLGAQLHQGHPYRYPFLFFIFIFFDSPRYEALLSVLLRSN